MSLSQLSAARHALGPAIVVAGPGSGKTYTTVKRLKYLIDDLKVEPPSILSITFTRLAAFSMRSRAQAILGDSANKINFSTFHSLFFKILKHSYRFTSDNIIKSQTKINILKDVLAGMGIEPLRGMNDIIELLNEFSAYKASDFRGDFSSRIS